MTLDQLMTFAAAAKYQNVTKAAREVGVSQPWVSQRLKLLEADVGSRLYRRIGNGIELTENGQLFLMRVRPILDQLDQLTRGFKSSVELSKSGTLRVGGTFNVSAVLLPALLARFKKRHPEAELELRTRTPEQLESLLITDSIALAVTLYHGKSPLLTFEPLRREKIVMYVPAAHRFTKMTSPPLTEVLSEPLVIRSVKGSFSATELVLNRLRDTGVRFRIGIRCEGPAEVKAAVRHGLGIGMAFADTVKSEVKSGEFKILNVRSLKMEGQSYIAYRHDRTLSLLAKDFLELLRRARPKNKGSRTILIQPTLWQSMVREALPPIPFRHSENIQGTK